MDQSTVIKDRRRLVLSPPRGGLGRPVYRDEVWVYSDFFGALIFESEHTYSPLFRLDREHAATDSHIKAAVAGYRSGRFLGEIDGELKIQSAIKSALNM